MEYFLTAEKTPMGSAIPQVSSRVEKVSTSVSDMRSQISSETGCCHSKLSPKSPYNTMLVIHFQYCTIMGWSSPKRARRSAAVFWSTISLEAASVAM